MDRKIDAKNYEINNPVADYMERATTYCVAIPANLNWRNFDNFIRRYATAKPTTIRLYVQQGFSDADLDKVQNLIKNAFDSVNIVGIFNLTAEDINRIQEFVDTYFAEDNSYDPDSDMGKHIITQNISFN